MGNKIKGGTKEDPEETRLEEDIMIITPVDELKKKFVKDQIFVWYDSKRISESHVSELNEILETKTFLNLNEVVSFLKENTLTAHIITSGTNGEAFSKEISGLTSVSSIFVYCMDVQKHRAWSKNYPKVIRVENDFKVLISEIKKFVEGWCRENSSWRVDFPAFAPIFDDKDKSTMNDLHILLKGMRYFKNRGQAKRDFLTLSKSVSKDIKNLTDFEKKYAHYDMKAILNWYTKDSFLYKVTNNCLRIANPDSINYCRLILKDLEVAIKEKYNHSSKNFSGLLFRGAYISENEWITLQNNIGREIEMYGFLSTSKSSTVALKFVNKDKSRKAFITIIVPAIPEKAISEQGFAEVIEFSDFKKEDEVLFNVRSRFTVLEASVQTVENNECRHLVLFYGAYDLKRYLAEIKISTSITLPKGNELICSKCKKDIPTLQRDMDPQYFISISRKNTLFCKNCFTHLQDTDRSPLLCASALWSSNNANEPTTKKIEGLVLPIEKALKSLFYGYNCGSCQNKNIEFFSRCLTCKNKEKTWCNACFDQRMKCIDDRHLILVERSPYAFWTEILSESEMAHHKYQNKIAGDYGDYSQGHHYYLAKQYDKARKYFDQFLERNQGVSTREVMSAYTELYWIEKKLRNLDKALEYAKKAFEVSDRIYGGMTMNPTLGHLYDKIHLYNDIGSAYIQLGQYESSIEPLNNAKEICKMFLADKATSTLCDVDYSSVNIDLGIVFWKLKKYDLAIEHIEESLKIDKSVHGNNYASALGTLGSVYFDLQNYSKAMEYFMESLQMSLSIYGENHLETAKAFTHVGNVHAELKEMDKAIEFLSKSLQIHFKVLGQNHTQTVTSYRNLANAYKRMEKWDKSLEYHMKELEVYKTLPNSENEIAKIHYEIGLCYFWLGERLKAESSFKESLKIKRLLKDEDMEAVLSMLGVLDKDKKEYHESLKYFIEAVKINKERKGKPKALAMLLKEMGNICIKSEVSDFQNAFKYLSEAVELFRSLKEEKELAEIHYTIGLCFFSLGERLKAEASFKESLKIKRSLKDEDMEPVLTILGALHKDRKEYHESLKYFIEAVKENKERKGKPKDLAVLLKEMGNICVESEISDFQNASKYLSEAAELFRTLEKEKELAEILLRKLGFVYKKLNQLENMIQSCKEGLELTIKIYGESHLETVQAYYVSGAYYLSIDQFPKALEYFLKASELSKTVEGGKYHECQILEGLAFTYKAVGHIEKSIELRMELIKTATNIHDSIRLHHYIADSYMVLKQYKQACEFYLKEMEIKEAIEPQRVIAECNTLSRYFLELKQHNCSLALELKALQLKKRIFEFHQPREADILERLGRYQESLEVNMFFLKISEALMKGGANPKSVVDFNLKIGNLYIKLNQNENAKEFYLKALHICKILKAETSREAAIAHNRLKTLNQQHMAEGLEEALIWGGKTNKDGYAVWQGKTKNYYCGRAELYVCQQCDGTCSDSGCNCPACEELDKEENIKRYHEQMDGKGEEIENAKKDEEGKTNT